MHNCYLKIIMEELKSLKHIYYGRNKGDILCWYKDKEIKIKDFLIHFSNMINFIKINLQQYEMIAVKSNSAYFKLVAFYSLLYLGKECCPYEVLEVQQEKNYIVISENDINIFEKIEEIIDITNVYDNNYNNAKTAIKLLSSGTSGKNKIISLTFNNILMSLNQFNKTNMYSDKDICISFFDMYHIYGIYAFVLFLPWQHISFVLLDKMIDCESYYDYIKKYNITIIHTVPCLLESIKPLDKTKVRYVACSSSSLNSYEQEYQEKRLKVPIYQLYGCTECSPLITLQTPETHFYGGVGKILDDIEFKIENDGELILRGKNVYTYPEWYNTGDIVNYDENTKCFTYISRKRDMIKYNAKQIIPSEIEEIVKSNFHADVCLCGIKENYNEYPVLFTEKDVELKKVQNLIQSYKKPKEIYKINKFLMTKSRKIKKYLLVQPFEYTDFVFINYDKNNFNSRNVEDKSFIFIEEKNEITDVFYDDKLVFLGCVVRSIEKINERFIIKTNKKFPFITSKIFN